MTQAPGDPSRFFVVGQDGEIVVIHNGIILEEYFIDIGDLVYHTGNSQGLLCAAFDPQYQDNGYFYVIYTRQPIPQAVPRPRPAVSPAAPHPQRRVGVAGALPDRAATGAQPRIVRAGTR